MSSSPMPDQVNSQQSPVARPELQSESDRLKLLLDLTNALVSNLEPREVLRAISASIRQVMHCDVVGGWGPCREQGQLRQHAMDYREITELKDKLAQERLYLEDEIRGEMDFEGIVGQSSALRHVLKLVETVAPSDSTVLLLGETGTGKELIARAIHERSRRKERTLVKLNCAAIPTGLLESELFGHERDAFTGAIAQKIGRLELADQGTLFLDEVGDIPIEIQPKLLRALQER